MTYLGNRKIAYFWGKTVWYMALVITSNHPRSPIVCRTTNLVICTLQVKGRLYFIKDVRNKQQRVCKIQWDLKLVLMGLLSFYLQYSKLVSFHYKRDLRKQVTVVNANTSRLVTCLGYNLKDLIFWIGASLSY